MNDFYDLERDSEKTEEYKNTEEYVDPEHLEGSSFTHRAASLDELMTLDENGTPFSIRELGQLKDLREELDK